MVEGDGVGHLDVVEGFFEGRLDSSNGKRADWVGRPSISGLKSDWVENVLLSSSSSVGLGVAWREGVSEEEEDEGAEEGGLR